RTVARPCVLHAAPSAASARVNRAGETPALPEHHLLTIASRLDMVPISYYIHAGRVTDPRMLSLTRKTEYALIALFHLARESERVCTAREISARYHLPPALLMNVLKCLASGDLLLSTRGAKGGYRLALPPEAISLSAIIA